LEGLAHRAFIFLFRCFYLVVAAEWERRKEIALYSVSFAGEVGFSGLEGDPENNWCWLG
jgi:hypothetical protein